MSEQAQTALYFGDFRVFVTEQMKNIEQGEFESYSTEWFLLKYLKRIVKAAETPINAGRIAGAMRALMRFYIDNVDAHSDLGDQCIKIYNEYRKTMRTKSRQTSPTSTDKEHLHKSIQDLP